MRKNQHGRTGVRRPMPLGKAEKESVRALARHEGFDAGANAQDQYWRNQLKDLATLPNVRAVRSRIAELVNA